MSRVFGARISSHIIFCPHTPPSILTMETQEPQVYLDNFLWCVHIPLYLNLISSHLWLLMFAQSLLSMYLRKPLFLAVILSCHWTFSKLYFLWRTKTYSFSTTIKSNSFKHWSFCGNILHSAITSICSVKSISMPPACLMKALGIIMKLLLFIIRLI